MTTTKVAQPQSYAKSSRRRQDLLTILRTPGAARRALQKALPSHKQINRLLEMYTHGVFSHVEREAVHKAIDSRTLTAARAGFLIGDGKRRIAEFDAACLQQQEAETVTPECVEAMAEEYAADVAAKANREAEARRDDALFDEGAAEDKAERRQAFDKQAAEFGKGQREASKAETQETQETKHLHGPFYEVDAPLAAGAELLWDC